MQAGQLSIVDDKMLGRTRTWLLSRRDGKGGFERNAKAVDSFGGAPPLTTDAYIVWALLQAGETGLDKEKLPRCARRRGSRMIVMCWRWRPTSVSSRRITSRRSFSWRSWRRSKNKEGGRGWGCERPDHAHEAAGRALAIETTALSTLAWEQDRNFAGNAEASMTFLWRIRARAGGLVPTQSTDSGRPRRLWRTIRPG